MTTARVVATQPMLLRRQENFRSDEFADLVTVDAGIDDDASLLARLKRGDPRYACVFVQADERGEEPER